MNLVLDDACEVHLKKNTRTPLGKSNITSFISIKNNIIKVLFLF
jgi:hypothetical protein